MFSLLCQLASAFVGAVIPVFFSYKTIKRPSQKSLSYWSKYWAVFGSFLAIDAVLSTLFIHYFIPFYEFGKLIFLIWAVNPQTAGAQFVFDKMLAPFIRRHERKLDIYVERVVNNVVNHGPSFALTAGTTLWTVAKNIHALSYNTDAVGGIYLQDDQKLTIAEIQDGEENEDQAVRKVVTAIPDKVEVPEPNSDDEVICLERHKQNDGAKSTSSKIPDAVERKCTRRAARSGARRNAKKKQKLDDPEDVEDKSKVKSTRRPRRVASNAAKKQLIIAGNSESGSDA